MSEIIVPHKEQLFAKDLMKEMVRTSQRPEEGNQQFVQDIGSLLDQEGFDLRVVEDPEYSDRSLLIVDIGKKNGLQTLSAISHSDVVGVSGQKWSNDPWTLHEDKGLWFGRGVCDTHGSGVSMLLAAPNKKDLDALEENDKRVSIIFTYDEEATSEEFSMRGARLAAGLLGVKAVAEAPYFIAGEPTETRDGKVIPMRSHKGRFLAEISVNVDYPGHVSDNVQNALHEVLEIGAGVVGYDRVLVYGSSNDDEAKIYNPPRSTVQVSAANVKNGDFSTTPEEARIYIDMRTLPDVHELRVREMTDLLTSILGKRKGVKVTLEVLKDAPGSVTDANSPVVKLAQFATGHRARGFNGGDEGRIMRVYAGKEGVTVGPGELRFAHKTDEQVPVRSIYRLADIYSKMFSESVQLL